MGTCSQHQWSVSASEAPKRRGATLGARHNAASTHPLLVLSTSLSPSFSVYVSFCFFLSLLFGFLPRLHHRLFSFSLSPEICENLRGAIPLPSLFFFFFSLSLSFSSPSVTSFEEKESSRIFLPTHDTVRRTFISFLLPIRDDTCRARSILLMSRGFATGRVISALFSVNFRVT